MVEYWLGNLDLLINRAGLPRRFVNADGQARRVLERSITPLKPDGSYDPSMARAYVAKGLILHGYADEEIAALLLYYGNFGQSSTKGTADIRRDIGYLIGKYRAANPTITINPTRIRGSRPPVALPDVPRAKRGPGRPPELTVDEYRAWLHENRDAGQIVFGTIREIAARLAVSPRTIERLDAKGRAAGWMRRGTSHDRRSSWIELLDNDPPPPDASARISTRQVPHKTPRVDRAHVQEEHTAPVLAVPAEPPRMPDPGPIPIKTGGGGRSWLAADTARDAAEAGVRPPSPADVVARSVSLFPDDRWKALRWARAEHGMFRSATDGGRFYGMYASEQAIRSLAAAGDADAAAAVAAQRERCNRTVPVRISQPPRRIAVLTRLDPG